MEHVLECFDDLMKMDGFDDRIVGFSCAATLVEKARRLDPEMWGWASWLASIYGLLSRKKDAPLELDIYNEGRRVVLDLPPFMYGFPFKDRAVADRFAEGLTKAGIKGNHRDISPPLRKISSAEKKSRDWLWVRRQRESLGMACNGGLSLRKMENLLGAEGGQFHLILVRVALKAI